MNGAAIIKKVALTVSPTAAKLLQDLIATSKSSKFLRSEDNRLFFIISYKSVQRRMGMKSRDFFYVLSLLEAAQLVIRHFITISSETKQYTEINFKKLATYLPEDNYTSEEE